MKILLATDASDAARSAEALASAVVWPEGSRMEIFAVDRVMPGDIEFPPDAFAALHQEITGTLEAHLRKVAASIDRGRVGVTTRVRTGRPASLIVEEAARYGADIVIVGSHGRGRVASALIGSVAAEVVDHAQCPVLVARRPMLRGVVLADDGSAGSRLASDLVAGTAVLAAVPVHVVSVLDLTALAMSATEFGDLAGGVAMLDALRRHHLRIAQDGSHRLAARGLTVTSEVREGGVAASLIDAAEATRSDLIVVGSRGTSGVERLLLGSVARSVLFQAPCSVLVVHRAPERRPTAGG